MSGTRLLPYAAVPARAPMRPVALAGLASRDGAFAFAAALLLLFIPQLFTVGVALLLLTAAAYVALTPAALGRAVRGRLAVLCVPGLALASTLWSRYPGTTLYYGVQFAVTVYIAMLLAQARRQLAVICGICAALVLYLAFAVTIGRSVGVGGSAQSALAGLTGSKNFLGEVAAFGGLTSLVALLYGRASRSPSTLLLGGFGLLLSLYCVVGARATGAAVSIVLAVAFFAALWTSARISPLARALATTAVLVMAGAVGLFAIVGEQNLLGLVGKNATLTGRTYLWFRAETLFALNPWLGNGSFAFWVQGNPDAEALWSYAQIPQRMGFNFHNFFVETRVDLGLVGLVTIVGILLASAVRLYGRFRREPTLWRCFWLTVVFYGATRAPVESILWGPFNLVTILFFAAFAASGTPIGAQLTRNTCERVRHHCVPDVPEAAIRRRKAG